MPPNPFTMVVEHVYTFISFFLSGWQNTGEKRPSPFEKSYLLLTVVFLTQLHKLDEGMGSTVVRMLHIRQSPSSWHFSHKEKTWLPFSCVWLSSFTVVRLNNTSVAETFLLPVEVKNSSHQSLEDCAFVIVFIPFHHRLQIKSNVTITSINNTRSSSPNSTTHNTAISLTKRHSSITDSLIPYSSHNHANPLRVSFPSLSNA